MAGFYFIISNGKGNGFFCPYQDYEFFATGDACVEEISLEEFEMARMNGNDDAGALTSLVFMDRDSVGEDDFIELNMIVTNDFSIKRDIDALFFFVYFYNSQQL